MLARLKLSKWLQILSFAFIILDTELFVIGIGF